jgi:transcription termination factor 2
MRCLRRICGIKWQDMTPNTEVLLRSKMYGIQYYIIKSQFRWTGHVIRMPDDRIPKQLLFGELSQGKCQQCCPFLWFKDSPKRNLKSCLIVPEKLESFAADRAKWRHLCHQSLLSFESSHISDIERKRLMKKSNIPSTLEIQPDPNLTCSQCGRICRSKAGLLSHQRGHRHREGRHWLQWTYHHVCMYVACFRTNEDTDTERVVTDYSGHTIMYVCMYMD